LNTGTNFLAKAKKNTLLNPQGKAIGNSKGVFLNDSYEHHPLAGTLLGEQNHFSCLS
jgi:hypothetical protein